LGRSGVFDFALRRHFVALKIVETRQSVLLEHGLEPQQCRSAILWAGFAKYRQRRREPIVASLLRLLEGP
jgi:hypothetical protein